MKKAIIVLALAGTLSGCAGLDVEWQLSATYQTEELRAKRRAIALEALDQAADARKAAEVARTMQP